VALRRRSSCRPVKTVHLALHLSAAAEHRAGLGRSRKRWSSLTIVTVVLTAFYQWAGIKFSTSISSRCDGIFLVFGVTGFAAIVFGAARRRTLDALDRSVSRPPRCRSCLPCTSPPCPHTARGSGCCSGSPAHRRGCSPSQSAGGTTFARRWRSATLAVFATWLSVSYASHAYTTWWRSRRVRRVLRGAPAIAGARPVRGRRRADGARGADAAVRLCGDREDRTAGSGAAAALRALFGLLAILAWRAVAQRNSRLLRRGLLRRRAEAGGLRRT